MKQISCIRALKDNYIWVLHGRGGHDDGVLVVDPGDDEPVRDWLQLSGLALHAILVTHHHWDHTDGIQALVDAFGCEVYGPAYEDLPVRNHALGDGDSVTIAGWTLDIMEVPGHTAAPIAWYGHGIVLTGDTLFAAGCGRLFEGTPAQMQHSLARLRALPGETLVYCAHEYTRANLAFAKTVEPGNAAIDERMAVVERQLASGQPSVPTRLADEWATNPFLRWDQTAVISAASKWAGRPLTNPEDVFATVRRWKDQF